MNAMDSKREVYKRRKRREVIGTCLLIFGFVFFLIGFAAIMWNGLRAAPVFVLILGLLMLEAVVFEAYIDKQEEKKIR